MSIETIYSDELGHRRLRVWCLNSGSAIGQRWSSRIAGHVPVRIFQNNDRCKPSRHDNGQVADTHCDTAYVASQVATSAMAAVAIDAVPLDIGNRFGFAERANRALGLRR
ncbi:hypothetical protein VTI28DRAFT_9630 [Corynascus sepedonium]